MTDRTRKTKGNRECFKHPGSLALTNCKYCGKPICKSCIGDTSYPHTCPDCYPLYYENKMKKKIDKDSLFMKFLGVSFIVLVLMTILIPGLFYLAWRGQEDHGSRIPAESRVYISSSDVYLKKVGPGSFELIVYLTNHYDTAVENVQLDLLLLKQDAIVHEEPLEVQKIDPVNSIQEKFIGLSLGDGTYTAVLKLWQKGVVTGSTDVSFTVNEGEVNDLKRGVDKVDPKIVFQEEINIEAEENELDRFVWVIIVLTTTLIAGSIFVIVVFICYYQKHSKEGEEND